MQDRRALKQLALAIGGCLSTALSLAATMDAPAEEAALLSSRQCGLDKAQRLYLQATAAMSFNASCTYRAEFGPGGVTIYPNMCDPPQRDTAEGEAIVSLSLGVVYKCEIAF